jgi:hypothetical protein
MHEALPRRDATHLKRGSYWPPKKKTVALPVLPLAAMPLAAILLIYAVTSASALNSTPSGVTPVST